MKLGTVFAVVGLAAAAAGTLMWWAGRPQAPPSAPEISPAALYAASFEDVSGRPQPLGQFQGQVIVLNFWATWCAPCREEMPAFNRVNARWSTRGVRVVGLSGESPELVSRFAHDFGIEYPLWTGGDEVLELSRRLGNRQGVLPFTAILGRDGRVRETRVGPYTELELDARLQAIAAKSSQ